MGATAVESMNFLTLWFLVTVSLSCIVSEILQLTEYVSACGLEKYFSFDVTFETTGYIHILKAFKQLK